MYHIVKASRAYEGLPYCGPSSKNIPMEFVSLEVAKKWREDLHTFNPIGWEIYCAETGNKVVEPT